MTGQWSSEGKASVTQDLHPHMCEPVQCLGPPPQPKPNSVWLSGPDPNDITINGMLHVRHCALLDDVYCRAITC